MFLFRWTGPLHWLKLSSRVFVPCMNGSFVFPPISPLLLKLPPPLLTLGRFAVNLDLRGDARVSIFNDNLILEGRVLVAVPSKVASFLMKS